MRRTSIPDNVGICHCTDCQHLTGSVYRVTVSVPKADFRITAGEPKTYVKTGDNGRTRYQMFCGNCGSPIYTTGNRRGRRGDRHPLGQYQPAPCACAEPSDLVFFSGKLVWRARCAAGSLIETEEQR